jgi:hypothetical protein
MKKQKKQKQKQKNPSPGINKIIIKPNQPAQRAPALQPSSNFRSPTPSPTTSNAQRVNRAFLSAIVESQLGTDPVSTDNKEPIPTPQTETSNQREKPTQHQIPII